MTQTAKKAIIIPMNDNAIAAARTIASLVAERGGAAYYVGGCVRDRLLGQEPKDTDIELHGIDRETAGSLLSRLGPVKTAGKGFEIFTLPGMALDISLPISPRGGPRAAAARRDFTVNALMEDVLTGELLDFFGGQADLDKGIIRHIGSSLTEDPLRVFRTGRFAAQLSFDIAPETAEYARTVDTGALPRERVMGELSLALKTGRPSVFFESLKDTRAMEQWFAPVQALSGVPQNPAHHKGDVWEHTMAVVDRAVGCRDRTSRPLYFMTAALCHDLGKAVTTIVEPDGRVHAPGHAKQGAETAREFLRTLTSEKELTAYVSNMTLLHMLPNKLGGDGSDEDILLMLDKALCPEDLLLLSLCDARTTLIDRDFDAVHLRLRQLLSRYRELTAVPYADGRELMDLGIEPGPALGEALRYLRRQQLKGTPRQKAIAKAVKKYKGTP